MKDEGLNLADLIRQIETLPAEADELRDEALRKLLAALKRYDIPISACSPPVQAALRKITN